MQKIQKCEVYRYTINSSWEMSTLDIEYTGNNDEFQNEASFYLSEMVTCPKTLFAILFTVKTGKVKPILLCHYSILEKAVIVDEIKAIQNKKWFNKVNPEKLHEILTHELVKDVPDIIKGCNLDYLIEA